MPISYTTLISILLGVFSILFFAPAFFASDSEPVDSISFNPFHNTNSNFLLREELKPDRTIERKFRGGEEHFYSVYAEANTCLTFIAEQINADIKITIKNDKDKVFKMIDRSSGSFGPETVTFIVPQSRVYIVKINTWQPNAPEGTYRLNFTIGESITSADKKRDVAENLSSEGEELRNSRKAENKKKALEKFTEALRIWQELDDEYEQAVIFYGMAWAYHGLSEYSQAVINFSKALQIMLKIEDVYGQALNHAGMGSAQYVLNENELSAYNYEQAIGIYRRIGQPRPLAIALSGFGTVLFLLERDAEAISTFEEALRLRITANDKNGEVLTRISLGKLFLRQKNYKKALSQFNQAQSILLELKGNSEAEAELLLHFGLLKLEQGNLQSAQEDLMKALNLFEGNGKKLGEATILLSLSRVQTRLDNFILAREYIERAIKQIEAVRQSTPDFNSQIKFTATIQNYYEHYVLLLMKMHERDPGKGYNREALRITEQSRARSLLDQLGRHRLIHKTKIEPELLERNHRLREELAEAFTLPTKNNTNQIKAAIQRISAQYAETEAEINLRFNAPESASLPILSAKNIQDNLDDHTVLLEYALSENKSFLWFVTKNEIKSYSLPSSIRIEDVAQKVFGCISKLIPVKEEKLCRQHINELSQILLNPIADDIQNKRLLVVAQGFLQYVPFAALFNPNSQNYLIESNEIISLPSASALNFLRQNSDKTPDKTVAIFADPIYSPSDGRILNKNKLHIKSDSPSYLPRLFASKFEAENIASFANPEKVLLRMNEEANRDVVFNSKLQNYRILHFATHALIDDKRPELSSIALSFYDAEGNKSYGYFRANDILRLNLNADLVVLSSCRSGTGKQVKGEGIVSFTHSFFSVGAKRMISSVWDVKDKVAAEIMTKFYRGHLSEGKPVSIALREAQLEIMQDTRWKQPFYWSAFVMQGDWH
jgi:CHAT domain-containing protein